jgi:hypothetical protein
MILSGWMADDGHSLTLPNFDRHNGKTAKTRAMTAKRVASHKAKSNAGSVTSSVSDALPREEKRREELHTHIGSDLLDKNVLCPDWLQIPFCRWLAYQFSRSGRNLDQVSQETMIFNLTKRGEVDAIQDIDFSIAKQANSILDHKFDFQKARAGQIKPGKPERKAPEVPSHRRF